MLRCFRPPKTRVEPSVPHQLMPLITKGLPLARSLPSTPVWKPGATMLDAAADVVDVAAFVVLVGVAAAAVAAGDESAA